MNCNILKSVMNENKTLNLRVMIVRSQCLIYVHEKMLKMFERYLPVKIVIDEKIYFFAILFHDKFYIIIENNSLNLCGNFYFKKDENNKNYYYLQMCKDENCYRDDFKFNNNLIPKDEMFNKFIEFIKIYQDLYFAGNEYLY